jgi:phage terminase large subunit GpA-like protein
MDSTPEALAALEARLNEAEARALKPPPRLNLVQWADTYRQLVGKYTASPGAWKTSSQPVTFGPMLAVTEIDTTELTFVAATQVAKTEILMNAALYFIHQDPSGILYVLPDDQTAEDFSKERFAPTVDAMPELAALIAPAKGRDGLNTVSHKEYPGGSIDFAGSYSPTGVASRPKRVVIMDEIDKFAASAGTEGPPRLLAEKRASTWKKRKKLIRACSPTMKETSDIAALYEASDRRRCFVICPHCHDAAPITWARIKWEKLLPDGTITFDVPKDVKAVEHYPDTACVICEECGVPWTERERILALKALEHQPDKGWRQTRPFKCRPCGDEDAKVPSAWTPEGRAICEECETPAPYRGHAGFHIPRFLSIRHDLSEMVESFLDARGDPGKMQIFVNTELAEVWEGAGEALPTATLAARAEAYGPDSLPRRVMVLTAGVDVQDNRLECQVVGWGTNEESWPIAYHIEHGDPSQGDVWRRLDDRLKETYQTEDGRTLRVQAGCVDLGGHHADEVWKFCLPRLNRRIFPTMGRSGPLPIWNPRQQRSKSNRPYWVVGVDSAKDSIYGRLKLDVKTQDEPQPGFIHFTQGEGFGPEYFDQLTSEVPQLRRSNGRPYRVWVLRPKKRNEALDTFVYALAARRALPLRIGSARPAAEETTSQPVAGTVNPAEPVSSGLEGDARTPSSRPVRPVQGRRRVSRSSYMGGG